jgi:hypothetical protein
MNNYPELLKEVKDRIRRAQIRATMSANAEMILMYWDVGRIVATRQETEGWGASIIPRLSKDIRNDLTEIKGFSERNIGRMLAFYREYSALPILPTPLAKLERANNAEILPTPLAKLLEPPLEGNLPEILLRLPWAHNATLLRVKDLQVRLTARIRTRFSPLARTRTGAAT